MDEYDKLMGWYWKHPTYIRFGKTVAQMLNSKTRARALKKRDIETQFLIMTQPGATMTDFWSTSMYKEFSRILTLVLATGGKRRKKYVAQLKDYFLSFLTEILIFTGN
jgi:hypothetical protein